MGGQMAQVILFHHALGVTDGVMAFADDLRAGGNQVTVADLFGGTTFDAIEDGVAYEEELGWDEMIARSEAAIAPLPPAVVIGGFSLGAVYGQRLAQTREGAVGALHYHGGDIPPAEFEAPWPAKVALQVHVSEGAPPGKRTDPKPGDPTPGGSPPRSTPKGERGGQVSLTGVPRRGDLWR